MTAADSDPEIEYSPHSGEVTQHGETVDVQIYRIRGSQDGWSLEVVNPQMTSTVWDELFPSDAEALQVFWECVRDEGIETSGESGTRH